MDFLAEVKSFHISEGFLESIFSSVAKSQFFGCDSSRLLQ